ncbi:TatD family hydrolase [Homoserinimonas sp. OAct 916]|uniref:TatD family hydrolase n=1 Tax=Homoserinimonas sp. OAct 916 TaxID=2211450 RepID=UPI000DBE612E|nr:TatD family hydrolase [Homoserinimonas sp. OAct 916]
MTDTGYIRQRDKSPGRDLSHPPLPQPLVVPCYDNHAHLEIADGDEPLEYREHLDRAASVGIRGVVQVGGDVATSIWSAEQAAIEPRLLAAVAIHPNEAPRYDEAGELDDAIATIAELATRPRVRAIGETGLDFFRTPEEGRASQHRSFEAHIQIAKDNDLAMQIHDRDAHDAVIETLLRVGAPSRTVFHCFSGDAAMAALCADNGWYLSFAGNITFKNAEQLREALRVVPRNLLLVETDAPFLTPMPFRGRPNSPYLVPHTLRAMAEYLGAEVSILAAQISSNTELVYGSWDAEPVTTVPINAVPTSAVPTSAAPTSAVPAPPKHPGQIA